MRDDLLDAKACIDWTISKLPAFKERIETWLSGNFNLVLKELPLPATDRLIVAVEKEPLSRDINVEAGAYINTIRSSLDLLATALAERYSMLNPEAAYFPIAQSATAYLEGRYKGLKFVKALPKREQAILETLHCNESRHRALRGLHELDITRKHRRLVGVSAGPGTFHITGWGLSTYFTPLATGWMRSDDETLLGFVKPDATDYQMKFTPYITFNEANIARKPIDVSLRDFASLVNSIINLFDN